MPTKQSYGKQPPEVLEKDHAVVEGIDLPGHWNRMFGTRVSGSDIKPILGRAEPGRSR